MSSCSSEINASNSELNVLFRIEISKNYECNVIHDIHATAYEKSSGGISVEFIDKTGRKDDDDADDDDNDDNDGDREDATKYGPRIGSLEAYLLRRGGHRWNFHEMCDIISDEIQEMGVSLFDHTGKLRGPINETITDAATRKKGGVLYITAVRVNESHRGRNIGLHFMKAAMDALNGKWVMAIIFPAPEFNKGPTPFDEVVHKLSRYFARLEYVQVCGDRPHGLNKYWVMESTKYSGTILPKEAVADLVINRLKHEAPSGVDKELSDAIGKYQCGSVIGSSSLASLREKLDSGIARGGSVDRAHCLIFAAANGKTDILPVLVTDYGAQVNCPDSTGHTALMIAAHVQNVEAIRLLLAMGADPLMKNAEGDDALKILRNAKEGSLDFCRTFGLDPSLADKNDTFKTCKALLEAAKSKKRKSDA
jgi:hypothetical protein